ncbi:MAG: hypothetical protein RMJ84_10455 [Sandaracinaceae bacterium]|nr:hypothetical protein [Sandaracinaceae bacterium]
MGVRDVVFPTPRHLIGMRYGLLEEVDFFTQLGIDLLLFKILLIDGGFVGQLFRNPQGPAGAASARLHLLFDLDDLVLPRLFPEAGIHFDHPLDSSFALLWGALLFLEPHPAYDRPDFFFAPYVGIDWIFRGMPDPRIEREKSALALGVSWINPWEGRNTFIRFFPDGMGAIAVILSFRYVKR